MERNLMLCMVSGLIFLLSLLGHTQVHAQPPRPVRVALEAPLAPPPVKANGSAVDPILAVTGPAQIFDAGPGQGHPAPGQLVVRNAGAGRLALHAVAPAADVGEEYNNQVTIGLNVDLLISQQEGLSAPGGAWALPPLFGSTSQPFNSTITIGPNGISIGGVQTFSLPDLTWGNIQIQQNTAQVTFLDDNQLQIELTSGEMRVNLAGGGSGVANNVKLLLDENGIRRGDIDSFVVSSFAGLELQLDKTTIANGRLQAAEAGIQVPKAWGGAAVALQGLSIANDGTMSINNGRFRLPSINAGGDAFTLSSLAGEVRSLPEGGYAISALGKFDTKQAASPGACTLWMDMTLDTGATNASVLSSLAAEGGQTVATPDAAQQTTTPSAPAGLRQLMLELRCSPGWAIGATGLFLTGIEAIFHPAAQSEQSLVKVWID